MDNFFTENKDIMWYLNHMDLDEIIITMEDGFTQQKDFDDAPDSVTDAIEGYRAVLELVGAISAQEIAPLAPEVDKEGAHLNDGKVTYAKGTQRAMEILSKSNLMGFTLPRRFGGINMPGFIYTIATELVSQADGSLMNLFGLQDIADTIKDFASEDIKAKYLPRFASGESSGAMDLTEPDAGSDLQSVRLKAIEQEDGSWRLEGVKRFITNGCADISLVLARSEKGTTDGRGLSMFLCEKCPELVVRRIEDKLGIHGSPTCELQFNGVPAILIGQRRRGLIRYVMALMNGARIAIAAQSIGIAQAAYEEALKYACERVQFKKPIIEFPQVYEMLSTMKVSIQASRAITYETSRLVDLRRAMEKKSSENPTDQELKKKPRVINELLNLLTPISKGFSSEICNRVTYDAIQIQGGTGYMRDFNVERHSRDARITSIYEGTTQLQVVGALGGILKGVLSNYLEELAEKEYSEDLKELAAMCTEMRDHFSQSLTFLKDANDKTYTDYVSRRIFDMGSDCVASHLLFCQAIEDSNRKLTAEKFVRDALPRIRMNADYIQTGNRLTIDRLNELL